MSQFYYNSESKFTKEITWQDVQKNFELTTAHEAKTPKRLSIMKELFSEIAGKDNILQGTELEAFMKDLQEYSDKWAKGKELSIRDLAHYAGKDSNLLSKIFADKNEEVLAGLISHLREINDQKLNEGVEEKQYNEKHFDNGKLKKEIINNEDNTITENYFDKSGNVKRTIVKDSNNKILEEKSFDNKGNITEHFYPENEEYRYDKVVEKQVKKDKNGNVISHKYIVEGGAVHELVYGDANKVVQKIMHRTDGTKHVEYLDSEGKVTKQDYYENGKVSSTRTYLYDEKNRLKKQVYKDVSGNKGYVSEEYYSNGLHVKNVTKDNGGIISTTKYIYDKQRNLVKKEVYNESNELEYTEFEYGDKTITKFADGREEVFYFFQEPSTIYKDADGNVVSTFSRKFLGVPGAYVEIKKDDKKEVVSEYSNYNLTKEVIKNEQGNILKQVLYEYNKNGDATLVKTLDGDGKIISTTQQTYDEKGRERSYVVRDGNGKITTKTVHTYTDTKNATLECIITIDENNKSTFEEVIHTKERSTNNVSF